jgi:hypothetical protein
MTNIDTTDREKLIETMADLFCACPLPKSVCSDPCVSDPNYPYPRAGTNLLTVSEAREMFRSILGSIIP